MTDEAGVFVGGHAMNKDNRLKTMSSLTGLWGGAPVARTRSMEGVMMMRGRRVSTHLMGQPIVIEELLGDPMAREQGFLARFLTVAPPSLAGTRMYRAIEPSALEALHVYESKMAEMLAVVESDNLERRVIPLSPEAHNHWVALHDAVEADLGAQGAYHHLKPIAGRMPEQVCRMAAIIDFTVNPALAVISADAMANAITLGHYYLAEAKRLAEHSTISLELQNAEKLRHWIMAQETNLITKRDIMQYGPNALQRIEVLEPLLAILEENGWLMRCITGGANRDGTRCREAWYVICS